MNEQEKIRLADYEADLLDVIHGRRPLAIIEHIKSPEAYRVAHQTVCSAGIVVWHHDVLSSNGEVGSAVAIARDLGVLARYQHLRNNAKEYTRRGYQLEMGRLLGYETIAIAEFIRSDVAKRCPCELCGARAHASQTELDAYKARLLPQVHRVYL